MKRECLIKRVVFVISFVIVCCSTILVVNAVENNERDLNGVKRGLNGEFGIDVSSYQGNINWQSVKESGVSFAILRITCLGLNGGQGENGTRLRKDTQFEANYVGAVNAGIKVGVYAYTYADSVEQARREAELVVSYLGNRALGLPVYYDIEDASRKKAAFVQENTDMAVTFCNKIIESGYWPGVYSSASFLMNYLQIERLRTYDMWAARYLVNDVIPIDNNLTKAHEVVGYGFTYGNKYTNIHPAMWQYSQSGRVNGINGNVDLNYRY